MRIRIAILVLISHAASAQFNYTIDQSIPVKRQNGEAYSMPWAGGMNGTQFNSIDLDGDGDEDLAIYERTADRVITFINDNDQYRYAPEYESLFPDDILNWMLLRDYNGDGLKDIFTGDNLGIKVYTNITTTGLLTWELFLFSTGVGEKSHVLLTTGFSGKINLQLNADDLPSINDADGDGDLDIFVPKYPSGSTIEFHKNLSVENGEPLDSLDFARTPQTPEAWGGVTECDCGEFAFNNEDCGDSGGRVLHAGGKSLFAMDLDNDGDQDMLFSEQGHATEGGCRQIFFFQNEGDAVTGEINSASSYPAVNPINILTYPAVFYEDVDFDGIKDLISSPNNHARELLQANLRQSVWFYKNTGTNDLPVFTTTPNTDFLQENMIDAGDNAVPAFFDADGDSDLDLFVGYYAHNAAGSVMYFENTGTPSSPAFELVNPDLLNMSALQLTNIKPFFADMNGDMKIDMGFTASNQSGLNTQLYYLPNQNSIGLGFTGSVEAVGFPIISPENICVTDVDRDGKNDLLVGKTDGRLQYWRNEGTISNPDYELEDDSFLGLSSSALRTSPACSTADLNGDGKTDLIIGDQSGKITIVSDFRNAVDATDGITEVVYNSVREEYVAQNLGGTIWPTTANLFKTDKPAVVIGNVQGGLHVLKHDDEIPITKTPVIDIYPNPARKESVITIKTDQPAAMITFSALGQQIGSTVFLQPLQEYNLQLYNLAKGIYLLYFSINGKSHVRKIVVN